MINNGVPAELLKSKENYCLILKKRWNTGIVKFKLGLKTIFISESIVKKNRRKVEQNKTLQII